MSLVHARPDVGYIEPDDADIPDPDLSGLKVLGDNLVLRAWSPPTTKTFKSGAVLHLPPSLKKDVAYLQNVGRVLKIGPTAYKDPNYKPLEPGYPHGFYGEPWVKEGDYVVWPRFVGQRFKYKGVNLTLITDRQVIFVLNDPKDIDTLSMTIEDHSDL